MIFVFTVFGTLGVVTAAALVALYAGVRKAATGFGPYEGPSSEPDAATADRSHADTDSRAWVKLQEAIALETQDDVATVLIERGTGLPASVTEFFTTGQDGQTSLEIHVGVGNAHRFSTGIRDLGTYTCNGILPQPAGVPQIGVTFSVDKHGRFMIEAKQSDGRRLTVHGPRGQQLIEGELE